MKLHLTPLIQQLHQSTFLPHTLQTAFFIFQNLFVHAHTISNKTTVSTKQVAVGRKVKGRATAFISWQKTFRILIFVPVTN